MNKYIIKNSYIKAYLFEPKKQNRRLTPREQEEEKLVASIFKRPQRHFLYDPPTYPFFPPEPVVNFNLKYVE